MVFLYMLKKSFSIMMYALIHGLFDILPRDLHPLFIQIILKKLVILDIFTKPTYKIL